MEVPTPLSALESLQFPAIPDPESSLQLALHYQLERSQWQSSAEIEVNQFKQLKVVLEHAQQNVPFYTKLFAKHGIELSKITDLSSFQKIPITDKIDFQKAGNEFVAVKMPAGHGKVVVARTSGSTGQPLKFCRTAITHLMWRTLSTRDHLWQSRDLSQKNAAIRLVPHGIAPAPLGVRTESWGGGVDKLFPSGPTVLISVASSLNEQLEWLLREKPRYLISLPSNLIALTRYAEAQGKQLPEISEIRAVGEKLSSENRAYLKEKWQAKVTDVYTCEEMGYLALQCPQNEHYHVQSENVLVEIVDKNGAACSPGVRGRVVLTSLNNFATPFIRYDIGDIAEYGMPCTCGRGLPVIQHIHGRTRNRLILPNGDSRFPQLGEFVIYEKYESAGIRQLKCIQHSLEKIEVQIVTSRELTADEKAGIIKIIQSHLGHDFNVELTFPLEIARNPNGKLEVFESRI